MGIPDPTGHLLTELGNWAVNGFFIASGYLITGSRLRSNWWSYLWRRILRIFPAYWVALLVVAFVLAPMVAAFTPDNLVVKSALGFPIRNALLWQVQDEVANTLTSLPIPHVWLGTAWTLFYEFVAYLLLGSFLSIAWVRRNGLLAMGFLTAVLVGLTVAMRAASGASPDSIENFIRLGAYFAVGSVAFFGKNWVRVNSALILISAVTIVLLWNLAGWDKAGWFAHIPLAYLVLGLGASLPIRLGASNDISYGIYLYGWPSQQLVVLLLGTSAGIFGHIVIALLVASVTACASWHLVEKPSLRFSRFVR